MKIHLGEFQVGLGLEGWVRLTCILAKKARRLDILQKKGRVRVRVRVARQKSETS